MQIVAALKKIHDSGHLHGDIKPENILLLCNGSMHVNEKDEEDTADLTPVFTDFGMAMNYGRLLEMEEERRRRGDAQCTAYIAPPSGTPNYASPEVRQTPSSTPSRSHNNLFHSRYSAYACPPHSCLATRFGAWECSSRPWSQPSLRLLAATAARCWLTSSDAAIAAPRQPAQSWSTCCRACWSAMHVVAARWTRCCATRG